MAGIARGETSQWHGYTFSSPVCWRWAGPSASNTRRGWTKPVPSVLTGVSMVASFYLLSVALKTLPVGTAYAVWTGIGAVGVAAFGIFFLGEPRELFRVLSICLIVVGIVGLRFSPSG